MGYVFNPLYDADPNYDYYMFNVYATVSSNTFGNWFVDSAGLNDPNGASLNVYAFVPCYANQTIIDSQIEPSGNLPAYGDSPVTTSNTQSFTGSASFFGVITASATYSSTVSTTFYPVVGNTQPTQQSSQCYVSWESAAQTNANPAISSYAYDFIFGVKVPQNQQPQVSFEVVGSTYSPYSYRCYVIFTCSLLQW